MRVENKRHTNPRQPFASYSATGATIPPLRQSYITFPLHRMELFVSTEGPALNFSATSGKLHIMTTACEPTVQFVREVCGLLEIGERREWLVTNGIGGYAS